VVDGLCFHLDKTIGIFLDAIGLTSILFDDHFKSDDFCLVLNLKEKTMEVH